MIVQFAQLFITNGVDVNQTNRDGENALMALCRRSQNHKMLEMVQLLITYDVDVHQRNKQGRNATDLLLARSSDNIQNKSQVIAFISSAAANKK